MTNFKRFSTTETVWQQRQMNTVRFERHEIDTMTLVKGESKG